MDVRTVNATAFKEHCLALLDQVALDRVPVVVTKRGRPVARLLPIDERVPSPTIGSVTVLVDDDELLFSTGEAWEAEA